MTCSGQDLAASGFANFGCRRHFPGPGMRSCKPDLPQLVSTSYGTVSTEDINLVQPLVLLTLCQLFSSSPLLELKELE